MDKHNTVLAIGSIGQYFEAVDGTLTTYTYQPYKDNEITITGMEHLGQVDKLIVFRDGMNGDSHFRLLNRQGNEMISTNPEIKLTGTIMDINIPITHRIVVGQ